MTATTGELEKAGVSWIKAASMRALKTAVTVAIPYFTAIVAFDQLNWPTVLGTIVLAAILSYATSAITGLPEVTGKVVPVWAALLERTLKTFAQAVVAGVGSSLIFQDVDWAVVLQASVIAAIGSLLSSLVQNLPETPLIATGTGRAGDPAVITTLPVGNVTYNITSSAPAEKVADDVAKHLASPPGSTGA